VLVGEDLEGDVIQSYQPFFLARKIRKKLDEFAVSIETAVPAVNIITEVGKKHPVKLYYFVILVVKTHSTVECCHSGE
jgi:hypothetical protein